MPSHLLYLNKYKPKALSKVIVTRFDSKILEPSGMRRLRKALMETKRACPLIIDLDEPHMKQLGQLLTWTNHWKELEFYSCSMEWYVNPEKFGILSRLKYYKALLSLSICFAHFDKLKVQKRITKHFSNQTKYLKKLKTANLDFNYIRPSPCFQILGRNTLHKKPIFTFKYPKSLSSLYLSFHETTAITKELLSLLTSNIPPNNSLEHLDLNLDAISASIEFEEKELWEKFFEKTQGLKTLSLTKHLFETQVLKGAQFFSKGFNHLKNLNSLNLNLLFYHDETRSQEFIGVLYYHLASLSNLKSLNLCFKIITGSREKEPPNVFPSSLLPSLHQLEQFHLKFDDCPKINDIFLQDFFRSLKHLENLKSFELFLTALEISSQALALLSQSLQNLAKLQVLSLYFPYAKQNSQALSVLSQGIAHLHLKSFNLLFSRYLEGGSKSFLQQIRGAFQKDKKELRNLFSSLSGFQILSTLNLDLSIIDLSPTDCENFSLALKELQQLKYLCLALPALDSANNFQSLRSILSGIKELPRLASLFLIFRQAVKDGEMDIIGENLVEWRSLEHLELRFKFTKALTRGSVQKILLKLRGLLFLNIFKIYLGGNLGLIEELNSGVRSEHLKNLDMFKIGSTFDAHNLTNPFFMFLQTPWK